MSHTKYIWDPLSDNVLMEKDENGATAAVNTYLPEQFGDQISQRRDGETSYYHYDGEGNTRALTDENGDVTDTYTYNASGEVISHKGNTTNPFGYKGALGYYANPETNDYYVRARTYEPTIARWLSADPAGFVDRMNLYIYVGNDPVNKDDLSGRLCIDRRSPVPQYHGSGQFTWRSIYKLGNNDRYGYLIQTMVISYVATTCKGKTFLVSVPCQVAANIIPPADISEQEREKYYDGDNFDFFPKKLIFWELFPVNADQKVITNKGTTKGRAGIFPDIWQTHKNEKSWGAVSFAGGAYFSKGQKAAGKTPPGIPTDMPDPPGGWGQWKSGAGQIPRSGWYSCEKPPDQPAAPAILRSIAFGWNECCDPAVNPETALVRIDDILVKLMHSKYVNVSGQCD